MINVKIKCKFIKEQEISIIINPCEKVKTLMNEFAKKVGLNCEKFKLRVTKDFYSGEYIKGSVYNLKYGFDYLNPYKILKEEGIENNAIIYFEDSSKLIKGAGPIDNLKNEKEENLGFDINLIKRNELYINLIFFNYQITNKENYEYYNNFKIDVVGGFYAIDNLHMLKNYLDIIKEKDIPFIIVCSGSSGKDVINLCLQYLFVKEVIIFCNNYEFNKHYLQEFPGYVKKGIHKY